MAIDTTKGLPSFSEMYAAMKNQGSLGEALKSGFEGYQSGVKANMAADTARSEQELRAAQAQEALAKAKSLGVPKEARILLSSLPQEAQDMLVGQSDENGTVAKASAMMAYSTTEQGKKYKTIEDKLLLQQKLVDLQGQLNIERSKNAEHERRRKEGEAAQQARSAVLTSTPKEGPTVGEQVRADLAGVLPPAIGKYIKPGSVEQAILRTEALKGSSQAGGNTPIEDALMNIDEEVIQVMQSNGTPATIYRKNLAEAQKRDPGLTVK